MNKKAYYGEYGGQFVSESLMNSLEEIDRAFEEAIRDPEFIKEYHYYLRQYVGRETPLYLAGRLSEKYGTKIYLKREDLNHTGAHVAPVFCYCTTAMGQEHYAETIEYVRKKGIDAIAITSGGEAYVLSKIQAYAAAQGCPMNLPVYSYGPYTTRCAQEVSLPIAGTSPKYQSFKDFIDYLVTK